MITFSCKCGQRCDVPDSMAGSLTECPTCGSALLVPPANRPIIRRRPRAGRVGPLRLFFFTASWLLLFPVGCGMALLSVGIHQTMSGRMLGVSFNPCPFFVAIVVFSLTGIATYRYFSEHRPPGAPSGAFDPGHHSPNEPPACNITTTPSP